uniref:Uncharacterized protein n=1 Tax=Aegilops tauschii subsp. strangulata TaxID=200361 RepID=A0A452Y7D0_AEGTS
MGINRHQSLFVICFLSIVLIRREFNIFWYIAI